jgi:hypothetical protein
MTQRDALLRPATHRDTAAAALRCAAHAIRDAVLTRVSLYLA